MHLHHLQWSRGSILIFDSLSKGDIHKVNDLSFGRLQAAFQHTLQFADIGIINGVGCVVYTDDEVATVRLLEYARQRRHYWEWLEVGERV
jgi:hypothetical protein